MPREKRLVVVGTPCDITQRGNNRQTVFRSDLGRTFYLKTLKTLKTLKARLGRNHEWKRSLVA